MNNISYDFKTIENCTLIEAVLNGTVRNEEWTEFFTAISPEAGQVDHIYLMIDENSQESEVNYETAQNILKTFSYTSYKDIFICFVTIDSAKSQMARLYSNMADNANMPITIHYPRSVTEAKSIIHSACPYFYAS